MRLEHLGRYLRASCVQYLFIILTLGISQNTTDARDIFWLAGALVLACLEMFSVPIKHECMLCIISWEQTHNWVEPLSALEAV